VFRTCIQLYIPLTPACKSPRNLAAVPRARTYTHVHVTFRGTREKVRNTSSWISSFTPTAESPYPMGHYGSLWYPVERMRVCELWYSSRGRLIETTSIFFRVVLDYPRCETTSQNIELHSEKCSVRFPPLSFSPYLISIIE